MAQTGGNMSRYNATFRHKQHGTLTKGSNGFYSQSEDGGEWINGCECYVERYIPAKQRTGTDGQIFTYNYEVFIPKHYRNKLDLNAPFQILMEDGTDDEFTIQGIDNLNRRSIILWG